MHFLLQKSQYEFGLRKCNAMSLEYLDLVAEKLAFESAVLRLIEVYVGRHGSAHANAEFALKYMQLGAAYGFPSPQRKPGIVTRFGLLGVPKNEVEASILLSAAAAKGDRVAQKSLVDLSSYRLAKFHALMDIAVSDHSFS